MLPELQRRPYASRLSGRNSFGPSSKGCRQPAWRHHPHVTALAARWLRASRNARWHFPPVRSRRGRSFCAGGSLMVIPVLNRWNLGKPRKTDKPESLAERGKRISDLEREISADEEEEREIDAAYPLLLVSEPDRAAAAAKRRAEIRETLPDRRRALDILRAARDDAERQEEIAKLNADTEVWLQETAGETDELGRQYEAARAQVALVVGKFVANERTAADLFNRGQALGVTLPRLETAEQRLRYQPALPEISEILYEDVWVDSQGRRVFDKTAIEAGHARKIRKECGLAVERRPQDAFMPELLIDAIRLPALDGSGSRLPRD